MRVKQHMRRWYIPPAKTAKLKLSQVRRVLQIYLHRASASSLGLSSGMVCDTFLPEKFIFVSSANRQPLGRIGAFSKDWSFVI